jgi:hypothetical protein
MHLPKMTEAQRADRLCGQPVPPRELMLQKRAGRLRRSPS